MDNLPGFFLEPFPYLLDFYHSAAPDSFFQTVGSWIEVVSDKEYHTIKFKENKQGVIEQCQAIYNFLDGMHTNGIILIFVDAPGLHLFMSVTA